MAKTTKTTSKKAEKKVQLAAKTVKAVKSVKATKEDKKGKSGKKAEPKKAKTKSVIEQQVGQMSASQKTKIISDFAVKQGDTGSPEVQIALLTNRINNLATHLGQNKKDNHCSFCDSASCSFFCDIQSK